MNPMINTAEIELAKRKLQEDPRALIDLQPLPAVAMKVNQACRDTNVDLRELARLVESDPAFAVEILSVVNSSLYGHARQILSIHQAIVVLGRRSLVQHALSIAAKTMFTGVGDVACAKQSLFEHSLAVASVAVTLVRQGDSKVDLGTVFLAGIFHDIGKVVLLDVAPCAYSNFMKTPTLKVSSIEFEQNLFGIDHTILGRYFAESWKLAGPIQQAITGHHLPKGEGIVSPISESICLANQLVKAWGIGQTELGSISEYAVQWLNNCDEETQQAIRTNGTENYEECKALFTS